MKWSVLGGVALAVSLSSSAFADGYDRPAIYEPAFSWTGFYIGVHGGWENRRSHGSDLLRDLPEDQHIDGWFGGGQLGYNHQFGRVVVGTALSGSWANLGGSENCFAG